ncbi:MAG: hypothetical protein K0S51_444 [Bacillales bacterium]|nr:hypothetical protein [Bacillales bacterium]
MRRFVAFIVIVIPMIIATVGVKLLRDSLFNTGYFIELGVGIQALIGTVFLLSGSLFIAGFIQRRDEKKKKFRKKISKSH